MKAELLPLRGKYYGTKVKITDDYGNTWETSFWEEEELVSREPSDRQLEGICTIEQYRNDDILKNYYNPEYGRKMDTHAQEAACLWGEHFESRRAYEVASKIVAIINSDG